MSDLAWGLQMTVAGMGTVFLLLAVLMGLLLLIGRVDRRTASASADTPSEPAPVPVSTGVEDPPPVEGPPAVRVLADGLTEDQLAAITVAVLTHRDIRRAQGAPEQRVTAPGSQLYASRWLGIGRGLQTTPWRRK